MKDDCNWKPRPQWTIAPEEEEDEREEEKKGILLLLLLLLLLLRDTHSVHVLTSLDAMSFAGKAAVETGGRRDYTYLWM
jgi:hypothetical protein